MSGSPRPLIRPLRPLALVAAALLVVAATRAWAVLQPATSSIPARPAAIAGRATGSASSQLDTVGAAIAPPDGLLPGADPAVDRLDHAIAAWTANLRDDPADFLSATDLALDDYSRGRLTGDIEDYGRARDAVARALAAYPNDTGAQALEAVIRATLHDFAGALSVAGAVYATDPSQLQALATMGDAAIELGRYGLATTSYATLARLAPGAATTARLAHDAQLHGRLEEAERLARRSVAEAVAAQTTGPGLAWYRSQVGAIAFQAGDLGEAEAADRAALTDWPRSYAAEASLGRVLAAEGRTDEAIGALRRSVAIVPQPDALAALGDLYSISGRSDLARQQYDTVRFIATLGSLRRQVFDRSLVLFDADHGVAPDEAVRMATAELTVRKDIYGWDALAWALLADGRPLDAEAASSEAMALGTRDALLDYHAGMIAATLGRTDHARRLLEAALALGPDFQPLQAVRATSVLARLDAETGARLARLVAR